MARSTFKVLFYVSMHDYYCSLITQGEDIQANITNLLAREAEARHLLVDRVPIAAWFKEK